MQSYTALKYHWTGQPSYPPSAVPGIAKTSVFVSWNGATEVESWQLRFLLDGEAGKVVATADKTGFETEMPFPEDFDKESMRYFIVEALDSDGHVLGKTDIVDLWAAGLVSRVTQMVPLSGVSVSFLGVLAAVAVVLFVANRIVKARMSGYQKLRRH